MSDSAAVSGHDGDAELQRLLTILSSRKQDSACRQCNRTAVDVLFEEHHSCFRPYGMCSKCGNVNYFRFDAEKVQIVKNKKYTVLSHFILKSDWDMAVQRIGVYPNEVLGLRGNYNSSRSAEGEYRERSALYFAIEQQAPLELIRLLAKAAPSKICEVFYDYYNEWAQYDMMGFETNDPYDLGMEYKSPLQLAVSMAGESDMAVEMVKILLIVYLEQKSAKALIYNTLVAIDQAYKPMEKIIAAALSKQVLPSGDDIFQALDDNPASADKWKNCWEALTLIYRAIYFKCIHEDQSVLQAIAGAQTLKECPQNLLRFAIKMYPPSRNGAGPLHAVASTVKRPSKPKSIHATDFHPKPSYHQDEFGEDCDSPFQVFLDEVHEESSLKTYKTSTLKILVAADPEAAAVRDQDGSLALHRAIRAGRNWGNGVKEIVAAFPDGLKCRDPCNQGLVPFMQAASSEVASLERWRKNGRRAHLDFVYQLLRSCPEACAVGKGGGDDNVSKHIGGNNVGSEPAKKKMRTGIE